MYQDKSQTDGKSSQISGTLLGIGSTENNQDEYACEYQLGYKTDASADARLASVLSESAGCYGKQDGCTYDGAYYLEDNIHDGILTAHSTRKPYAKGNGRVDVAT